MILNSNNSNDSYNNNNMDDNQINNGDTTNETFDSVIGNDLNSEY